MSTVKNQKIQGNYRDLVSAGAYQSLIDVKRLSRL